LRIEDILPISYRSFVSLVQLHQDLATMSIRGTAGYNLGGPNTFGGPSMGSMDKQNDPSPLDAIREQTSKIEDFLDTLSDPVKPYVLLSCSLNTPQQKDSLGGSISLLQLLSTTWTNTYILQILTSNRALSHRGYFHRGCDQNHYAMERSIIISARLPTQ
jgi:hypothetical protein